MLATMKVDGSCYCGAITFEAEVDPAKVELCHCADCQRLSSSAFRIVVPAVLGSFRLLSGAPTIYVKTADNRTIPLDAVAKMVPSVGTPLNART